ncbi:MAG: DUF3313 domain-containing protein [Deltaproteobacteria bacterium]|nr:DUF3313 domain-containing protein [Deltaproteobacteria bacterium]
MWLRPLGLAILLAGIVMSGCATIDSTVSSAESQLKAPPSDGAGFVPVDLMYKRPDMPFNKAWLKQGVDWSRYRTIYIARVHTGYLMQANWWQQNFRVDHMQQDVANIAAFMRTQFMTAFWQDPNHRFRVVPAPERGSLILELALTELVPSDVLLDAIKIGGPYGSGVAAAVLERTTQAQSTVAFEARVKDADTGETVALFADREYAVARPIDLKGLTWYGNAEDIITTWAKQFVEIANKRPGEIIKPASTFSLMPW